MEENSCESVLQKLVILLLNTEKLDAFCRFLSASLKT